MSNGGRRCSGGQRMVVYTASGATTRYPRCSLSQCTYGFPFVPAELLSRVSGNILVLCSSSVGTNFDCRCTRMLWKLNF